MSDHNKPVELKINGFAEAPGGEYAAVRINGRGKITGDVVCSGDFTANGSGDVSGNLECAALHVNGSGHFFGNVKTGTLSVCGLADVDGTATAQSITV